MLPNQKIKNFSINAEYYYINENINLLELLLYFQYNDSLLVLEYNGSICNQKNWKKILIQKDDKIEIISIVGGG